MMEGYPGKVAAVPLLSSDVLGWAGLLWAWAYGDAEPSPVGGLGLGLAWAWARAWDIINLIN